jgi:hypothetical protein
MGILERLARSHQRLIPELRRTRFQSRSCSSALAECLSAMGCTGFTKAIQVGVGGVIGRIEIDQ